MFDFIVVVFLFCFFVGTVNVCSTAHLFCLFCAIAAFLKMQMLSQGDRHQSAWRLFDATDAAVKGKKKVTQDNRFLKKFSRFVCVWEGCSNAVKVNEGMKDFGEEEVRFCSSGLCPSLTRECKDTVIEQSSSPRRKRHQLIVACSWVSLFFKKNNKTDFENKITSKSF